MNIEHSQYQAISLSLSLSLSRHIMHGESVVAVRVGAQMLSILSFMELEILNY